MYDTKIIIFSVSLIRDKRAKCGNDQKMVQSDEVGKTKLTIRYLY